MPKYVLPSGGGSQIRGGRRYSHFAPLVSSRMSSDPNVQGGFSSECDGGVSRGEDEDNSSEEEGQFKNALPKFLLILVFSKSLLNRMLLHTSTD